MWRGFPCGPVFCTGGIFDRSGRVRSIERCGGSRDVDCCGWVVVLPLGDNDI
jgi:hypothetical protein